jgi:CDGSH-type Zn-finger protein
MDRNYVRKESSLVEVIDDGPLKITGNIFFKDMRKDIFDEPAKELYLCRCGGSCSKPHCDGSHKNRKM